MRPIAERSPSWTRSRATWTRRKRPARGQGGPRGLRRPMACGWPATWRTPARSPAHTWPSGVPVLVEERVRAAPRAVGAGGAVAVRAGRRVAGGRDGAARRHLRAGDRPRPRAVRRHGVRRATAGVALGRRTRRGRACSRSSCSRPPRATCWSTSSRCARTTPGTGPWTGRAPASSNSTCARCSTTRSATPPPSRR